jgi:hypothetical protein
VIVLSVVDPVRLKSGQIPVVAISSTNKKEANNGGHIVDFKFVEELAHRRGTKFIFKDM